MPQGTIEKSGSLENAAAANKLQQKIPGRTRRYKRFSKLSLGIALIATGIAFYALYISVHLQKTWLSNQAIMNEKINHLNQKQVITQTQTQTVTTSLQQNQKNLDRLTHQLNTASPQHCDQSQDWQLLKTRYYLELAQVNAYWGDAKAAISLLEHSDTLLKPIQVPAVLTIRQALAKEIAQLKTVVPLDTSGLLNQLNALEETVSNLTLPSPLQAKLPISQKAPPVSSAWNSHWHDSIDLLKKLIIIRRDDDESAPLISGWHATITKDLIGLNLQQAQWAVLNQAPSVYSIALKQAVHHLKKIYHDSPAAVALIKQLETLQHLDISRKKVEIDTSLSLLTQLIEKNEAHPDSSDQQTKGANEP